jgi:hypothetical protein
VKQPEPVVVPLLDDEPEDALLVPEDTLLDALLVVPAPPKPPELEETPVMPPVPLAPTVTVPEVADVDPCWPSPD